MKVWGASGYAIVAFLYCLLCLLLVVNWQRNRVATLLIGACVVSMVWGVGLALGIATDSVPGLPVFLLEVLRFSLWTAFVSALIASQHVRRLSLFMTRLAAILVVAIGFAIWIAETYFGVTRVSLGHVMIPGGLLLVLIGLVLLEQLYRNSVGDARAEVRLLAIAIGGMFAYDVFLYAEGLMLGALDAFAWNVRGIVNIVFVPMIVIAARRNPRWDLDIFVSRQVVFYTSTLIAIGVYLLVMSVGGYLIVRFGGEWGPFLRAAFFTGSIVALITLLYSGTIKARFKVFLSKHFFRNKYDYREEWLRLVSTMSGFEDSSTRQLMIKAVAQIVHSPSGLLWLLDDTEQEYQLVAAYGVPLSGDNIGVDDPLIHFIERHNWLIDLREYRELPALYENSQFPERIVSDPDAWLIVPLASRNKLLGLVLVHGTRGMPELNYEDRDLLKTVGQHVAVHLAQENSDNLLAQARQFEAYNRLTAFLMHDLNNLIAQQSLIVDNAERHKRNPEFVDDAMNTIAGSVARMRRIMDQLKRKESDAHVKKTVLKFVISMAADRCSDRAPLPGIDVSRADVEVSVDVEKFVTILSHLIRNAQDATPETGSVTVSAGLDEGTIAVAIEDTGSGMSADFIRERLFRPFDSTKGSQGMGIGAYQAREFARSMGGDLKVTSEVGVGTRFVLWFPEGRDGSG